MIQIRQAQVSDAQAVQTVLRQTWLATYGDYLSQTILDEVYAKWQSIDFLSKQIENPAFCFLVAQENEEVVGVATAALNEGVVTLFRLYILPSSQRLGVGTQLLQKVEAHFPDAPKMQLHVEQFNFPAQHFYQKHGFRTLEETQEQIGDQVIKELLLEKTR